MYLVVSQQIAELGKVLFLSCYFQKELFLEKNKSMSSLGVYCSGSDVAALVQESRNLTRKSTRPGGAQTV